ncbi:MAG TPA: ATP-binding cassette domain-containing protein [Acidimicrobiia bacterium]
MVEVEELVKVYPGEIRAVDDISFEVNEGEVFGFLGPNGAGKTTTIRMIVTLLRITSGRIVVAGIDVSAHPELVRRRVGYAAQSIGIDGDLTARENLVLQARLHGVGAQSAEGKAAELLEISDLTEAADRRAGTFSGGMRRRLDLAQALVHEPPLLFLDEPTTGLDPQSRRAMWSYLRSLNENGATVFLTTQYMEEADELASRLAIIDHGRIVAEGSPESMKDDLGGDVIEVTLPEDAGPELPFTAQRLLEELPGAGDTQRQDHAVSVFIPDGGSALADLVRRFDAAGVPVARLELHQPTFDDVFLHHTGERMRVEEVRAPSRIRMGRRRSRA